jgi:hypothetical protein
MYRNTVQLLSVTMTAVRRAEASQILETVLRLYPGETAGEDPGDRPFPVLLRDRVAHDVQEVATRHVVERYSMSVA